MEGGRIRILIVDEEPSDGLAIRRALERAEPPFELEVAGTLREYKTVVDARPPDLVLVDLNLSDGRAVEILTSPAEAGAFPVLIMTNHGSEATAVAAMKAGALDYVVKSPEAFLNMPQTIAGALRQWRLLKERQQVQAVLRDSEERYRTLAGMAPVGIFRTDPAGKTIFVNQRWCEISGLSPDDALGEGWIAAVHPDDRDAVAAGWNKAATNRQPSRAEYRFVHPDGTIAWVIGQAVPEVDSAGQIVGYVGTITDITEHKRADALKDAIYEISEATQQAVGLDDLFAAVHHIVSRLMEAQNFYIALYDSTTNLLAFPYFVDEMDDRPDPFPAEKGLTSHVVRTGQPLLATPEVLRDFEERGEIRPLGTASIDWLGVPLKVQGRVIGVLTVQSYGGDVRYSEGDQEILSYVSAQVAQAIERKRAEEALRSSESQLQTVLESSSEGILAVDNEGKVIKASRQFAEMWNIPPSVIESGDDQVLLEFVLGQLVDRNRFLDKVHALYHSTAVSMDTLLFKDGRVFERLSSPLMRAGTVAGRVWSFLDITERKLAQDALRESEEKYRSILEAMQEGYYEVDLAGNFAFVNESMSTLLGYSRAEMLGMNDRQYTNKNNATILYQTFNRVYSTGQPTQVFDWEIIRKDGAKRFVEASISLRRGNSGQPIGFRGVVRDITERKLAEQELREGERHYRALFEAYPIPMCIYDPASLRILAVNPAATRTYGWSREEFSRLTLADISAPEELALFESHLAQLPLDASTVHMSESWHHRRKDGTTFEAELNSSPVSWEGRPARVFTAEDVTERRQIQERLLQSEKIAAVGQLAGGIAHDFNNILQAMLSLATVLRLRSDSPELAATVAEIEAHIRRGASLTQQLLLFSRREISQRQRQNLGEVVSPAISMLRHLLSENIKISLDLAPEPLWFDGDGSQIHQVLINLALNAKDAMPSGGAIFLRTGRDDGEIWLEVEDQGCGMSPEVQTRIFEPFFTTKDAGHGTGLGLSVVHGIVERHGGRIEVTSQPGKGSRFRVFLPESLPPEGAATREPGGETELTAGRGRRVLIVEDEEGARNGLVEALEFLGFNVTAAASGEEAQTLAAEPGFDLLLTDLVLPGMDGSALARVLCERWPNLKVIMMSGYTEDEAVRRGVDAGRVRFLQKPFEIARLDKELGAALAD